MKAEWPISDWSTFLKSVPTGSHTTHASTRVFTATWSILPKKLLIFSLIFDFIKNGILGLISWLYNPLMGLPLIGHEWNLKKNKVQQDTVHFWYFVPPLILNRAECSCFTMSLGIGLVVSYRKEVSKNQLWLQMSYLEPKVYHLGPCDLKIFNTLCLGFTIFIMENNKP